MTAMKAAVVTRFGNETEVKEVERGRIEEYAERRDSASFAAGDATTVTRAREGEVPLVVVNPPRRGLGPQLAAALECSGARHLIYSSCNARTLARDLAQMPSWRAREGRVLDMFPHTGHYEVAMLLERR